MILPDFNRLRTAFAAGTEPDRSPKRFAPYAVWKWARITALIGYASVPLGALLTWLTQNPLPALLILLGAIIIVPGDRQNFKALTPEIIGGLLGSRYCPDCGQSIFDRAPPTGYMADHARGTWWPHRSCANCGHDLKVRTVD